MAMSRAKSFTVSPSGISVSLYPETGARRIIEVKLELPSAAKTDEDAYTAQLDKAAFAGGTGRDRRSRPAGAAAPPGPRPR